MGLVGLWWPRNSLGRVFGCDGRGSRLPVRLRAFRVVTIEAANGGYGGLRDVPLLERLNREMARGHV